MRVNCLLLTALLAAHGHALGWVGNTKLWLQGNAFPARAGFLNPNQSLTFTTETWPVESGQRVFLVTTTNNWQSTQEYEFTYDYQVGNNSKWYVIVPPFPKGSHVNAYIRATKSGQANAVYDNNASSNYGYIQRFASPQKSGAILQWFATPYSIIRQRLPEVIAAGYSAIYLPMPSKGGGGGFSVGYNPVDHFDLGDRYQKGTVKTQYGTTQELQDLIHAAHRFGLEIYCDIVLNHMDNRASTSLNFYPNMIPEDFHIASTTNPTNTEINFNNESAFSFGMLNYDLLGLADIALEDGNNVQSGTFSLPGFAALNSSNKPSYIRQPTVPQLYPSNTPVSEDVREYLDRFMHWLVLDIGMDGFRLDAVKHVPPGYWGWAPDQAASQGFTHGNLVPRLLTTNPDLTLFGECYSTNSYELKEYAKTGMNLIDFPYFFGSRSLYNSNGFGDLGAFISNGFGVDTSTGLPYQNGGLSDGVGVAFVQSHDDGPPTSNNLAYATMLARSGRPKVYFDGNNIQPGNWSNFPRPGRFDALGASSDSLTKLVEANSRFMRGDVVSRWSTPDLVVLENQVEGKGIALIGLNDRGDQSSTAVTVATAFPPGTILTDLSGQGANVTVGTTGTVSLSVPSNYSSSEPNNGHGYVVYVPVAPGNVVATLLGPSERSKWNTPVPVTTVATPGGQFASGGSYSLSSVTSDVVDLQVTADITGDRAYAKLDDGLAIPGIALLTGTQEGLTDGFFELEKLSNGKFKLEGLDLSGVPDGLHLLKVRVFKATGNEPPIYAEQHVFFNLERSKAKVDGDLTDLGNPVISQSRNASSNLNRLDALYVRNDDKNLIIGVAGRVADSSTQTNGMSVLIDADNNGATGVNNLASLADDSGPAPRLLSNTRVTLPSGFGADIAVAAMHNASGPFKGMVPAYTFGAFAGCYQLSLANLSILPPIAAMIRNQVRVNKTDPAKGLEVAIPLANLYAAGALPSSLRILAFHGTTGETGQILSAYDANRGIFGGRPAATSWLSNQILPTQPNIVVDPGTAQFTLLLSVQVPLTSATALGTVNQGSLVPLGSGRYRQTLTVHASTAMNGPISLRIQVPSGVTVLDSEASMAVAGARTLTISERRLPAGKSLQVAVEYQSSIGGGFTPLIQSLSGSGIR